MKTLIQKGNIVTAVDNFTADILIDGSIISAIGTSLPSQNVDQIINAQGKSVIPGGIDAHTHLDMPFGGTTSADDFETGTRAAAFGGTTTIIDFAIQPRGARIQDGLETWWKKASGKACIDYGLHMIVIDLSEGSTDPDKGLGSMDSVVREGVTSFKLFMAYPGVLMVDDGTIYKALTQTAKNGALICMHAENGSAIDVMVKRAVAEGKTAPIYHALTRPSTAEGEAVNRAIALAEMAGAPMYIVHLSSNDALERVAEARDRGVMAYAETCPQYLLLSLEDMGKMPDFEGAKVVFTPPLREKWNQDKLWEGLRTNNLQVVSTDHCPFCFKEQKELGRGDFTKIPNGGPGIENRLQLLYEHGVNRKRITVNRWVEITSTTPAKMFGLYPRKGTIAVGSDADLVIWDPGAEHVLSAKTHHMRVDYSMFEGWKIKGNAQTVISRGEVIIDNGQWRGKVGRGEFLKRATYAGAWK